MKQLFQSIITAALILGLSCGLAFNCFAEPAQAKDASSRLPSLQMQEQVVQIAEQIIRTGAVEMLPNGNVILDYIVIDPSPLDPSVPYEEFLALIDPNGNNLWQSHTMFLDEEDLNNSEGIMWFVINQNSFTFEFYRDPMMDTMSWMERGFNGEGIDFSKQLVVLSDTEKRMIDNFYPFRVENYCFDTQENDRSLLINLQNGTQTEMVPGGSRFKVGATVLNFVEQDDAISFYVYNENCVSVAQRTLPVSNANERVAAALEWDEGVCILTTEYVEGTVIWRAYSLSTDGYTIKPTDIQYIEERGIGEYLSPIYATEDGIIFTYNTWNGSQLIDGQLVFVDFRGEMTILDDMQLGIVLCQTNKENGQITLLGYDLPGKQCVLRNYFVNGF